MLGWDVAQATKQVGDNAHNESVTAVVNGNKNGGTRVGRGHSRSE